MPAVSPSADPPSLPGLAWPSLHLLTLWTLAVAARLYVAVGGRTMFFAVRQSKAVDLLLLVLVLSFVLPAVLAALPWGMGRLGPRIGRFTHVVLVLLLLTTIALPLWKLTALGGAAVIGLAIVSGGLATFVYCRFRAARTLVTLLWPIVAIAPGIFLLGSPVARFLGHWSEPAALAVRVGEPVPVVFLVFDEFSGVSLMGEQGQIDAGRFPNFAALGREGTWYRNATTVSSETESSLTAMLTGNRPLPGPLEPDVHEFPRNLFTLLADSHQLTVREPATTLCPDAWCGRPPSGPAVVPRLRALALDVAVLQWIILLPHDWPFPPPDIAGRWCNFLGQEDEADWLEPTLHRREAVDEFSRAIVATEKPGLMFLHVALPHTPWVYLPSGKEYSPIPAELERKGSAWIGCSAIGLNRQSEHWCQDQWTVAHAQQRHLLQVAYADRALGRVITRLKAVGLYDRSLIVVTADHGVAFVPGGSLRAVDEATFPELAWVPLLIKLPGQRQGGVSDRNVESVDILPTIANVLDIELPWATDGTSVLASGPQRTEKELTVATGQAKPWKCPPAFEERWSLAQRLQARFPGSGTERLFCTGPHGELIGRPLDHSSLAARPPIVLQVPPDGQEAAGYLWGTVTREPKDPQPLDLAIAVNGTIRAMTRTFLLPGLEDCWTAMLPEDALRPGENRIELFAVLSGDQPRLRPIASTLNGKSP